MLYDYNSISEIDYQIYLKWFDTFAKDYPVSKVIYVKTDPYICYRRIKIRSRNGEVIPFEYLESCHEYHENMINLLTNQSVTVIDGNVDIKDNENILQVWFEKIEDVLYEYMH